MAKGVFITGTDTGVGKTVVARMIAAAASARGLRTAVYKPVETGCKGGVRADTDALLLAAGGDQDPASACAYSFELAAAPWIAARAAGVEIETSVIESKALDLLQAYDFTVIEGAGGLMVPVAEGSTWLEVAEDFDVPVLTVVANRLGCINHALLTLDRLEHEGFDVLGFVMNDGCAAAADDVSRTTNRSTIQVFSEVECLGSIGRVAQAASKQDLAAAASALDLGRLLRD